MGIPIIWQNLEEKCMKMKKRGLGAGAGGGRCLVPPRVLKRKLDVSVTGPPGALLFDRDQRSH